MIIEFRVGNFLSFKEISTLSFVATSGKEHQSDNVVKISSNLSLLKSAAVYGANGSGKSNLIHALNFMQKYVAKSSSHSSKSIVAKNTFRLSASTIDEPSFFEITFWFKNRKFRYGFEIKDGLIVTEWFFHTPKTKEVTLFTREGKKLEFGASFKEAKDNKGIEKNLKPNKLFLSLIGSVSELDTPSDLALQWFHMRLDVVNGADLEHNLDLTMHYLEDHPEGGYREKFAELLRTLDIFDDFRLDETSTFQLYPERRSGGLKTDELFSNHQHQNVLIKRTVYDKNGKPKGTADFDLIKDESEGTIKLFAFAGAVFGALDYGSTLVVDELELKLHPLITQTIIQLFNSKQTNRKKAQLLFTTHDTNLLTSKLFRRDQIWFTNKDRQCASSLYSLVEYKPRAEATFEKDYLLGRYKGIPFIGNINELMGK